MTPPDVLAGVDGLVCDLDGVVYRGSQPVPGAADAIDRLRRAGIKLLFVTNNATASVERRLAIMRERGIEATPDELVTSAVVTAEYLVRAGLAGATVFVIGRDGIRDALEGVGMRIVDDDDEGRRADVVVVSGDDRFTYDAMRTAAIAVRAGARFVASNDDATFPAHDGLWPGAGAILSSIVTAAGKTPEILGKPHAPMMEAAAQRLVGCKRIALVGDQPDTDLAAATRMGWPGILVLTGVTSVEEASRLVPTPDVVLPSIVEVAEVLSEGS